MDADKMFFIDQYGFKPRHLAGLAAVRFADDLIKDKDNL